MGTNLAFEVLNAKAALQKEELILICDSFYIVSKAQTVICQ